MNTDTLSLSRLPAADQAEAARWHAAFCAATKPITKYLATVADSLGASYQTARDKYYRWLKLDRSPAALVNAAKHPEFAPSRQAKLHPDLIQYYRQLCIENGRKCRTAWKKLCREFFNGADIPGVPHGTDRSSLPAGWHESSFSRHAPTPFELKAARQGLRSAAQFRPLVYTTRKEMYFFEEIQFDDVWHDIECSFISFSSSSSSSSSIARGQRVRPLQLGAMDVFTACLFEWCIKPRLKRDDDTRTNLGPNDLLFLLAAIFGKYGHNPRGTRLNLEAGTATLSDAAVDLVHRLSGGEVKVRIGETSAPRAFLGQYSGQAKGNFRTRALIESFWNLTHNETADRQIMPGQTGSLARVNAPDDLHGRARAQDQLLRAMPALPQHVLATLRQPLPEFYSALRALGEINERMNQRGQMPGTEHAIEGFIEAGLVTTDFDLPGLGLVSRSDFESRLAAVSAEQREAILALCVPRARKLSPREAFTQCLSGSHRREEVDSQIINPKSEIINPLKRWRPEALAQLLYPAHRPDPVTVTKDHLVEFVDRDVSPEKLRFLAHHFSPGDTFEVVINPMVPDLLFIYDARPSRRGAWLGVLKSWGAVSRSDTEALGRRIAEAESVKNDLLRPLQQLGTRLAEDHAALLEHNNAVIAGHTAAEREAFEQSDDRSLDAFRKAASKF